MSTDHANLLSQKFLFILLMYLHQKYVVPQLQQQITTFWNSLSPGDCDFDFKEVIFKCIVVITFISISIATDFGWMVQDSPDDKSTLVQVMAWCRQATSHYPSQCWPRSLSPYGVARPQWVKLIIQVIDVILPTVSISLARLPCVGYCRDGSMMNMGHRDTTLLWRHNGHDSVSNHQPHECLLNRPSMCRSKKTSKLRVTGLCAGNSPETGELPAQMASNAASLAFARGDRWITRTNGQ